MIEIKNLEKSFKTSYGTITALKDINLTVNDGEIFGIIGLSGAGKMCIRDRYSSLNRQSNTTATVCLL